MESLAGIEITGQAMRATLESTLNPFQHKL